MLIYYQNLTCFTYMYKHPCPPVKYFLAITSGLIRQLRRVGILVRVRIYRRLLWLVEMTISTNQKPVIYRNLYENTAPDVVRCVYDGLQWLPLWSSNELIGHAGSTKVSWFQGRWFEPRAGQLQLCYDGAQLRFSLPTMQWNTRHCNAKIAVSAYL